MLISRKKLVVVVVGLVTLVVDVATVVDTTYGIQPLVRSWQGLS